MLGYQHIYHAGNFADVQKHALLVRVLLALKAKGLRLACIDTHAGRGLYDLSSAEAQKTQEFASGIQAFWNDGPSPVSDYINLVKKYNPEGILNFYPGSAMIAKDLLRETDRLIFAELHPGEYAELQKTFAGVANIELLKEDGFRLLAEKSPPPERRGIAVIDPSYELKTDFTAAPRAIHQAWKKWPQGVFFLWYPILTEGQHNDMLLNLRKTTIKNILVSKIRFDKMPDGGFSMQGSGIAIVNPPVSEKTVKEMTDYVASRLKAAGEVFWLDNRRISLETGMLEA